MRIKKYVVALVFALLCVLGMSKDVMAAEGTCGGGKYIYNEATTAINNLYMRR